MVSILVQGSYLGGGIPGFAKGLLLFFIVTNGQNPVAQVHDISSLLIHQLFRLQSSIVHIKTPENASNKHLARILRDYLASAPYATDKRLDSEITLNHSIAELEKILENPDYSYLFHIDSTRMTGVRRRYGISSESHD